jgi:hypothetical protein
VITLIIFRQSGNFNNTERFFRKVQMSKYIDVFERYGQAGVVALASMTPIESGKTASSWDYKIVRTRWSVALQWSNSYIVDGVPIAIILQYGHGTRNGGYVQGRDYINPAIRPIFDRITEDIWREVTSV